MKRFSVYESPTATYVAVKNGFSFPGLFFQFYWLVYRGMFAYGLLFFLAYTLLGNLIYGMEKDPGPIQRGLMAFIPIFQHEPLIEDEFWRGGIGIIRTISLGIIIGIFGNAWLRSKLLKNGYIHIKDVEASKAGVAIESVQRSDLRGDLP